MFGGMHICAWPVSVQCVHTTCACGVCVHTHIMHVHVECVRLCLCVHTGVWGGSWSPALSPFAFLTLCRDTLYSHSPGRTALRPYGKARGVNLGNPATPGVGAAVTWEDRAAFLPGWSSTCLHLASGLSMPGLVHFFHWRHEGESPAPSGTGLPANSRPLPLPTPCPSKLRAQI